MAVREVLRIENLLNLDFIFALEEETLMRGARMELSGESEHDPAPIPHYQSISHNISQYK